MIEIAPLGRSDRERWDFLARGYKTFYETVLTDAEYDRAWQRLIAGDGIHGLGAHFEGRLVGIAHYLFHANIWSPHVCYLQDLFVDESLRGKGAARALIEAVAGAARERGAARLYWHTRHDNATARALYDKVAVHRGFVRYEHPLAP
jgi:GNAT superfamily N-acetyltransferase